MQRTYKKRTEFATFQGGGRLRVRSVAQAERYA